MRRQLIPALAAIAGLVMILCSAATAQAPAREPVPGILKQSKLTEKLIESFIASNKQMGVIVEKLSGSGGADKGVQAELERVARKNGFKDFNQYDDVATNISVVMSGIDPVTKAFTSPPDAIRKEIESVKADKTVPEAERKQMLSDLAETLKMSRPIQFKENIDLVIKHYSRLAPLLQ